jgi:type I restriction enzyme M protein
LTELAEALPPPEFLAQEIIDHLEAALASFRDVAAGFSGSGRGDL